MTRRWYRWWPVFLLLWVQVAVAEVPVPDPDWAVARAQFTTGIRNREPVDKVVVLSPPSREIYFFTDLRHLEGREVQHRWSYRGRVVSMKPFAVKGARWRVYSKNVIEPEQTGEWSVTVYDQSGWPLHTELFLYEPAQAGALSTPVARPEDSSE
ncbi:MAG TPA: DUF2914 domain-containing protein [Gammaproteobacteria bacterium]|nr:DUF2914 domain-containing protein [Gammaproteobacteria bacterium]